MRVIFFGTPDWAVPTLQALLGSRHEIAAVVSRPDRPRGRGRKAEACPVAAAAVAAGLPLLQPETLKDRGFRAIFADLRADIAVVVAYGRIIPRSMLRATTWVNVHFSVLPRWRGAAPVQRAILAGDRVTGVTTMLMDAGLDTGDILLARETPIAEEETSGDLGARLALLGAPLLLETLEGLGSAALRPRPQADDEATLAPSLTKDEAWIHWADPAPVLARRVRAFQPWPVARTLRDDREIRILAARAGSPTAAAAVPGKVLGVEGDDLAVACGEETRLLIGSLQPAGRRPMTGRAAVAGRHLGTGDRLRAAPAASGDRSV